MYLDGFSGFFVDVSRHVKRGCGSYFAGGEWPGNLKSVPTFGRPFGGEFVADGQNRKPGQLRGRNYAFLDLVFRALRAVGRNGDVPAFPSQVDQFYQRSTASAATGASYRLDLEAGKDFRQQGAVLASADEGG